jgi:hypothetical protein
MIANLHVIAFLPVASLALGIIVADAAPRAPAQEMKSISVATPWSLLRNDAGGVIDRVLGLPLPEQGAAG